MKSRIKFANENIKKAFENLEKNEPDLYKFVSRALEDIENNAFCGIQIPKRVIPIEYIKKFGAENIWKYNLPGAWRLIYSIENTGISVISIVLEWMDHKTYERRFKYQSLYLIKWKELLLLN